MKFCPQCYFIYENDQCLCDMDGATLVYNPTPFPSAISAAPNPAVISSANSQWWRFTATAVVGVVLGIALLYQVSIHPTSPQSGNHSSTQVTSDSARPVTDDSEAPSNLDLTVSVPLTPPIDATPAPLLPKGLARVPVAQPSLSMQLPWPIKIHCESKQQHLCGSKTLTLAFALTGPKTSGAEAKARSCYQKPEGGPWEEKFHYCFFLQQDHPPLLNPFFFWGNNNSVLSN